MAEKIFIGIGIVTLGTILTGIYEWIVKNAPSFRKGIKILLGNSYYIILYIIMSSILIVISNQKIQYILHLFILLLILIMILIHLLNLVCTNLQMNSPYSNEIDHIKLIIDKLDKLLRWGIDMIDNTLHNFVNKCS